MGLKELSIEDREIFQQYLKNCPNKTAMMNFTSLYIWKDWGGSTSWEILKDTLCVHKNFHKSVFNLIPISPDLDNVKAAIDTLIEKSRENNEVLWFREASDEQVDFFRANWGEQFDIHESIGSANYIYRISDLVTLAGKPYAAKRNHINKLLRSGQRFEIKEITPELVPACKEYLSSWMNGHNSEDSAQLSGDHVATTLALENMEQLGTRGICLLVNDKIQGLTLGDELNPQTVLIHIEKANAEIPGAYPYINQQFLERYWQDYTYVNREEDMGNPGLRKAKLSYHPCHMEKVFMLKLKPSH